MSFPKCNYCDNSGRYAQLGNNGGIDILTCGKRGCETTASQINLMERRIHDASIMRSQEILREQGRRLTFDDLLAQMYKQGFKDAERAFKSK